MLWLRRMRRGAEREGKDRFSFTLMNQRVFVNRFDIQNLVVNLLLHIRVTANIFNLFYLFVCNLPNFIIGFYRLL